MSLNTDRNVRCLIALELSPGTQPEHAALNRTDAETLAGLLAHDLSLLVPDVANFDLTLAAAHFDPAEAVRPGWPLHQRLIELYARAPGQTLDARVIALGADDTGEVPLPLQCDVDMRGGALRIMPFLVSARVGQTEALAKLADTLENELLDRGMARAETALFLQNVLGAKIEHVRFLTLNDLIAMTSMQYDNMGLTAVWPLIESALFAPNETTWLDAGPEPLVKLERGEAHMALFTPEAWRAHYGDAQDDEARIGRMLKFFEARQRQIAAVLETHGIPVVFDCCAGLTDARAQL
ncbi:hypothetical protein G7069_03265 [Lysobacter sp. HDW10]|jgi:hypothetical protein|uniref:hypothetical protein n=1 Tax=Lysobacter sp. HDW10 TaxID=2714936 RepID=UPI00140A6636|nr:hypothetical protein [Lysobacter sp. HDW10]QIK80704.1 hypothetical protein G7069_03265 [Lysobacter sp. HDW10]